MKRRPIVLVCVALVAVLAIGIVAITSRDPADLQTGDDAMTPAPTLEAADTSDALAGNTAVEPSTAAESSGTKDLFDQIQRLPVPAAAAKQMMAAYIEWKVTPTPSVYQYWQSPALRDASSRLQEHQIDEAMRQALVSAFGPSIVDDPDFASIFQPYRHKYPFLSASKQLELERMTMHIDRALINSGTTPLEAQATLAQARQSMLAGVKSLLTDSEFAEYQLRESPLSRTLANSGFKFSKSEFDALIPIMSQGPVDQIGTRRLDSENLERVRGVLGEERFLEYRKAQDPVYQMLSTIAVSHGAGNPDINAAYEAVYKTQQELAALDQRGPVPSLDGYKRKEELRTELSSSLRRSIGDEATAIFLRSLDANRGLMEAKLF